MPRRTHRVGGPVSPPRDDSEESESEFQDEEADADVSKKRIKAPADGKHQIEESKMLQGGLKFQVVDDYIDDEEDGKDSDSSSDEQPPPKKKKKYSQAYMRLYADNQVLKYQLECVTKLKELLDEERQLRIQAEANLAALKSSLSNHSA